MGERRRGGVTREGEGRGREGRRGRAGEREAGGRGGLLWRGGRRARELAARGRRRAVESGVSHEPAHVYSLAVLLVACKQSVSCMSPRLSVYSVAVTSGSNRRDEWIKLDVELILG